MSPHKKTDEPDIETGLKRRNKRIITLLSAAAVIIPFAYAGTVHSIATWNAPIRIDALEPRVLTNEIDIRLLSQRLGNIEASQLRMERTQTRIETILERSPSPKMKDLPP